MGRRAAALLAAMAVLPFAIGGWNEAARANGVPQLVKLTYLEGVSNFGPRNAEGVLEFSFAEAYLRVDVKNLTASDGYVYEGWFVASDGNGLRVGDMPVDASGIGVLEAKLTGLDRYDYNLFVIASRPLSAAAGAMPSQKSIAGRFAVLGDASKPGAGEVRPDTLPDTGEMPAGDGISRWTRSAAALLVVAGVGVAAAGFVRRRKGT